MISLRQVDVSFVLGLIFNIRKWARRNIMSSVGPRISNVLAVKFELGILETKTSSQYDNKHTKQLMWRTENRY